MKKLSILFVLLFSFTTLTAQEKQESIVVNYKSKIHIDVNEILSLLPSKDRAKMKAMYEKELGDGITLDYTLKTNGEESVYQLDDKINNSQSMIGDMKMQIRYSEKSPIYKFLKKGIYKREVEFIGLKKYIIKDSLNNVKWNISQEKSKILNFEVRKATGTFNNQEITAWYAPKLNIKDGPATFSGLPGLILKVNFQGKINSINSNIIITANQVDITDKTIIIKDPKGETITQKGFNEEVNKFIKKMMEMRNQGIDRD